MLTTNEYFDGKVKSIALKNNELPATVGVMDIGEYTFGTSEKETMTVVSGELIVKLPDTEEWKSFTDGDAFIVEANKSFDLKVNAQTAYLCVYG
ncbi:hypothetical protein A9Q99_21065 [Gammaproteobacteria bacterium 45_16_T64]|nr:hypothetical protein A9Q99_21065 [Gammaproteobacteria bacterium 45_16_T64]